MGDLQRQYDRRNYRLNLLEGVLFISTAAFTSIQIVIPALILRLGGGNVLVGALPVIVYVGLFLPQIFAARYVETFPWKKRWTLRWGSLQRMQVIFMAIALVALGKTYPGLALPVFLALYTMMNIFGGITTPGWFDFYAKLTPLRRRGRLSGLRTSLGSLAAFIAGGALTVFLSAFDFPINYAAGFLIAFLLQMSSTVTQTYMVEAEPSVTLERRTIVDYLHTLPSVFRQNRQFRGFIISSMVLIIANMPIGFFTVYALKRFDASESVVGEFTMAMMSTQVISAIGAGILADRYGNKPSLIIAASGMLLASLWALLAPSIGWFLLVFVFLGFNVGTELMARYNISAEYGPVEQRSRYVALMNTLLAPVYLSGLLGGWISDLFGYPVLFGVGVLFSLIGLTLLILRVKDPRHIRTAPESI
jgi:MFS family permease